MTARPPDEGIAGADRGMHRPAHQDLVPGHRFGRQQRLEEPVAAVRQRGEVAVDIGMGATQPRLDRPRRRQRGEAPFERVGRDHNLQDLSRLNALASARRIYWVRS